MKNVFLIIICLLLIGCKKENKAEEKYKELKVGYSTNLVSNSDRELVKNVFEYYKLSNIDLFFSWLDDFNLEEDDNCKLKDWDNTSNFNYDEFACQTRYEKSHKISDGNCRITSFALIKDFITIEEKIQNYGSYLMFDIDVLENNNNYKNIYESFDDFVSLFNEIDVSKVKNDDLKNMYSEKWNDYKIKINSDNVSLISVVLSDKESKVLFVGHSGVLINLGNKYMFIEKIAFENPYQITILKSKEDLKELFKNRPSYFNDEEEGPFVYENNQLLFSY